MSKQAEVNDYLDRLRVPDEPSLLLIREGVELAQGLARRHDPAKRVELAGAHFSNMFSAGHAVSMMALLSYGYAHPEWLGWWARWAFEQAGAPEEGSEIDIVLSGLMVIGEAQP